MPSTRARRPGRRGARFRQAFGKAEKEAINSSTEQLHEPRRTSIPAVRNFSFSGPSMKPQMSRPGFSLRITSHADFAPDRSHAWNSFEPSAGLISKTPSHFSKNGQRSGMEPEFITSTAVRTAAADEPDTAFATPSSHRVNIVSRVSDSGLASIRNRGSSDQSLISVFHGDTR